MKHATCAAAIAAGLAVLGWPAAAQTTPVRAVRDPIAENSLRVFASNGVKAVIEQLQPQCERATGRKLAIQFGSTTDLVQKINAGQAFDLTMLTSEAIDQLIKSGKVASKGVPLARCGVGVGIRSGAPRPDISTPEAMKRTLVKAKSVTYAEDGASRVFVERMEDRLGIASEVKAKTMLTHGSGAATANVADGNAELVLTLASEILPVHGIELVGPLPEALQDYVNFAAGVAADAHDPAAANAVIQFLKGPSAAPVYKAKGMEAR
jgi:molybdate transport system substrate-binding protein